MISVFDSKDNLPSESYATCTGCSICTAICPNNCIAMQPDAEGFLYPVIDDTCSDCGLCHTACPANSQDNVANDDISKSDSKPVAVFASWHLDENVRKTSSSGGVFTALAENIIGQGGVVVGAAFDEEFTVRHTLIKTSAELLCLRGSKYVQSEISPDLLRRIRERLSKGYFVLFSGTPCQVAGIRSLFDNLPNKLFLLDVVCHGVPSPFFFSRFIENECKKEYGLLEKVSFREKIKGWKKYTFKLVWEKKSKNIERSDSYMAAYLRNYSLRPCCYNCKYTNINRLGDLTLADFWGVAKTYPEYDQDDKGTSLILVNTEKGKFWLNGCLSNIFLGAADINTAVEGNALLVRPCTRPPQRETFYHDLAKISFPMLIRKYHLHGPTKLRLTAGKIKRILVQISKRLIDRH